MNKITTTFLLTWIVSMLLFNSQAFAFSQFKYAVIADPHMSVSGPKSPANSSKMFKDSVSLLQSTVNSLNEIEDLDFAVVLGDLTKDSEPWNVDRFKEVMDGLRVPYYVVLGNHDISPVDTDKTNMSPGVTRSNMIWTFQGHGYQGPGTHWSLDPLPNIHLVGLDSSQTGDWAGRITSEGLRFLERDLASNPDKLTIVILHHQLAAYCQSSVCGENDFDKFVMQNADEVLDIIKQHPQVALTMSGHRHISTRYMKSGNTPLFTCPSTMTWPMRYGIFTINNDHIAYTTHDVQTNPEVVAEAKRLIMEDAWWHPKGEHPMTEAGNKKFEDFMLSPSTMSGILPLSRETKLAVSGKPYISSSIVSATK